MKLWKAINEIADSGIIPALCGSYILLTSPGVFWGLIGVGLLITGIVFGYKYTEKTSTITSEVGTKEET